MTENQPPPGSHRDYPTDVQVVQIPDKTVILVGTAHISQESADLVRLVIDQEQPDCVCVELDSRRFEALSQPRRWESLDLKEIIRKKQLSTLMVNLLLASYQKRLGDQLNKTWSVFPRSVSIKLKALTICANFYKYLNEILSIVSIIFLNSLMFMNLAKFCSF